MNVYIKNYLPFRKSVRFLCNSEGRDSNITLLSAQIACMHNFLMTFLVNNKVLVIVIYT